MAYLPGTRLGKLLGTWRLKHKPHTLSLCPHRLVGEAGPWAGITETEATLGVGWGLQNPRGGKAGQAWSPFGKSHGDLFGWTWSTVERRGGRHGLSGAGVTSFKSLLAVCHYTSCSTPLSPHFLPCEVRRMISFIFRDCCEY